MLPVQRPYNTTETYGRRRERPNRFSDGRVCPLSRTRAIEGRRVRTTDSLITRRSQVQILPPPPKALVRRHV